VARDRTHRALSQAAPGQAGPNAAAQAGAAGGAGGCCGGGGPKVSKQAEIAGGVQKIAVDLSSGSYNPSEIVLKAGVPAEVTFGQSSGCTAQVQSQDLGFSEDLTGGPKTVKLPALKAGTYNFACGMGMVSGSIVVK
jgi:plastocyanin domain-containing protein